MCCDKDSLIRWKEGKKRQMSDAKAVIQHPSLADQCSASLWTMGTLGRLAAHVVSEHDVTWHGISPRWVQDSALGCPLPASCPSLAYPLGWQSEKQRRTLRLCKHCSATAKMLVCYHRCFSHRSKTRHYGGWYKEINSITARPHAGGRHVTKSSSSSHEFFHEEREVWNIIMKCCSVLLFQISIPFVRGDTSGSFYWRCFSADSLDDTLNFHGSSLFLVWGTEPIPRADLPQ